MVDAMQILWEYLTVNGTALNALVDARVWWPEGPADFSNEAAVILDVIDEDREPNGDTVTLRVQALCYGGTDLHSDASKVYRALSDRLHSACGERTASGVILRADHIGGATGIRDESVRWPYARLLVQVITAA